MVNLPSCSDYISSIDISELIKAQCLIGGQVEKNAKGKLKRYTGGFCIVFPFLVGSRKYAVRCWHSNISNAKERIQIISNYLKTANIPYFVDFEYFDEGIATPQGVMPIVVMDWVSALPIKEYIKVHLTDSFALKKLGRAFFDMVAELHKHNIAHGDLQHGNILVRDDGRLALVDYDSMYVPGLDNFDDEIKGLRGYQHPARWKINKVSHKADYFSELIIYTSIMALSIDKNLWNFVQMEDSDFMLFTDEDLSNPDNSKIFPKLELNDDLKILSQKIKDSLLKQTIDELLPLEQIVVPPKKLGERLSTAWENNGHESANTVLTTSDEIIKKWNRKSQHVKTEDYSEIAKNISKNW